MGFGIADRKAVTDSWVAAGSSPGLASAKSGARPWLADGLVPLFGAPNKYIWVLEEGGVQRGEALCLCFRVAFGVVLGERMVGLRFLYNSYNCALVNLRGAWMSALVNPCLRLVTGLVDRYDDAGESACVLIGDGEMVPGRFGGRVARRVMGRPREGAWGSIAWLRKDKLELEPVGYGDAIGGEMESLPTRKFRYATWWKTSGPDAI